jgi:hypothetical protein
MLEESKKALAGVLSPDQEKRFHQLQTQFKGVRAFLDPEVQSTLSLTNEQKDKINAIITGLAQKGVQLGDFEKSVQKANAVLTDAQQKAWKGLVGEPFDFWRTPRDRH